MIDYIYLEQQAADAPLSIDIVQRFKHATVIECDRYAEIFNRKSQNFRRQKPRPALILAHKQPELVLPAPATYKIGEGQNYYFSPMLNCLYDCRYCFLQGMYRSAHYVLFVNYPDFFSAIDRALTNHPNEIVNFFSGYDGDSLALEPVSRFVEQFLPFFRARPRAVLELRSKSTQIRVLQANEPAPNIVTAFSFTPQPYSEQWEAKVPALDKRIDAARQLQQQGWPIGLRFDPILIAADQDEADFQHTYRRLFQHLFSRLDPAAIHSVTVGGFRMPKPFFRTIESLYPRESLWAAPMQEDRGMIHYRQDLESSMLGFCHEQLLRYIPQQRLFVYL